MSDFDPDRILTLAQTLASGTTDEKIAVLRGLGDDPLTSGVLLRALEDPVPEVRLAALERLRELRVRPPEPMLEPLRDDDDPAVRALAAELGELPEAPNPLEQLIPLVERMADQLGPLGGLLRSMLGTLRDVGADDERTQLLAVHALAAGNPAAFLAVQQALRSRWLSVRLAALQKALELPDVTVPDELVGQLLADPNDELRRAAEALVAAGRVAPFDEDAFRARTMQSLLGGLAGGMGMSADSLANMMSGKLGGLAGGAAGAGLAGLSSLFGGLGGAGAGAGSVAPEAGPGAPRPKATPPADPPPPRPGEAHRPNGCVYVVGDERARDRLLQSIARHCEPGSTLSWRALVSLPGPGHWAFEVERARAAQPGWPEPLLAAGAPLSERTLRGADVARKVSEQIWGAAYADHGADAGVTLVFHDGMLSRAAWGQWEWSDAGAVESASAAPTKALLRAFLQDPTDDTLDPLPTDPEPIRQARD